MAYTSPHRAPHESFPQPGDGTIKVWRYLDLARFISLLTSNELLLTRVDLMDDEFEGSVTRGSRRPSARTPRRDAPDPWTLRREAYVSSWHANNAESEAMWRLYCGPREGVALRTSYETLDASLPPDPYVHIGCVRYIDYQRGDRLPDAHPLTPLMHKRIAFEHEREVRVLVWRREQLRERSANGQSADDEPSDTISIPWDVTTAVEHVYVSPYAPEWYRNVIEAVLRKFCPPLADRLVWSRMKDEPVWGEL